LLRQYSDAASTHASRVLEMAERIIAGEEQQLGTIRLNCRTAWEENEKARLALYRHEADHHCDRGASVPSVCDP